MLTLFAEKSDPELFVGANRRERAEYLNKIHLQRWSVGITPSNLTDRVPFGGSLTLSYVAVLGMHSIQPDIVTYHVCHFAGKRIANILQFWSRIDQ